MRERFLCHACNQIISTNHIIIAWLFTQLSGRHFFRWRVKSFIMNITVLKVNNLGKWCIRFHSHLLDAWLWQIISLRLCHSDIHFYLRLLLQRRVLCGCRFLRQSFIILLHFYHYIHELLCISNWTLLLHVIIILARLLLASLWPFDAWWVFLFVKTLSRIKQHKILLCRTARKG